MITLWDIPLSPYAQKVKLALLEKGLAFETREPNLDAPDAEFLRVSPRLQVPAFADDEARLFDSSIIVEYIEERWPESALWPKSALERARVRTLEELCDSVYDAITWGVAEVTVFARTKGEHAERMLETARGQVAGLNAWLERELEVRPFFNGEQFGFGDIAVYPFVNGAAGLGLKPTAGTKLDAWLKATRKRPSAERIKHDVINSLPRFMSRPKDIAEGRARREYRDHRLDWMLRSGGLEIVVDGIKAQNIRFSRDID